MELLNDFYLFKITLHCVPDWWSMFDLSRIATVVSKYVLYSLSFLFKMDKAGGKFNFGFLEWK